MAKFSPPPGTADIFPDESSRWRYLEDTACAVFSRYGYGQLRTPIFEYTEVFQRGLGDETEVVRKEMYTFEDRGGRSLTLRPEGTAGVMRALLNTDVLNGVEQRVYYYGPMFRGERPAAGRRRQFHQIGAENVGRIAPELDAECIAMLVHYLEAIGIGDAELKINTRGVMSDRPAATEVLKNYFSGHLDTMCDDCRERFNGNIWRILDCKNPACHALVEAAPSYIESFSAESRAYFDTVRRTLDALGIKYTVDPLLVRGLDYYVHTVWELTHAGLGAQSAVAGGGRYELFLPGENRPVCGVGFAAGMERLMMILEAKNLQLDKTQEKLLFLAPLGDTARIGAMRLAAELRRQGFSVACEVENKSLKAQLRAANRLEAAAVLILGDDELARGQAMFKNLADSSQTEVRLDRVAEFLTQQQWPRAQQAVTAGETKDCTMLKKKNLIFIGAPGAGKGTFSEILHHNHPWAHISTGDLLRDEIKRGSELGKQAEGLMKNGQLVPDEVVTAMVKSRLAEADCDNGFILDGFPRTIRQAELLNDALASLGKKLDSVVYFKVPDDVIMQRLTARVMCRKCGKIYNRLFMPPKQDDVCDDCGGELYQRPDDSAETAAKRLRVFYASTQPLIDYYQGSGLLYTITELDKAKIAVELERSLC